MTAIQRLNHNANTQSEVEQYFRTRALQLRPNDYVWDRQLTPIREGVYTTTFFNLRTGKRFGSFYVTAAHRNKGLSKLAVETLALPILTINDCGIAEFLYKHHYPHLVQTGMFSTDEYQMIERAYGDRRAARSNVYYMNHIDEGIYIMSLLQHSESAMRAYCIHPLIQLDESIEAALPAVIKTCSPEVLAYAMEYRNQANAWLSNKVIKRGSDFEFVGEPTAGPISAVREMLIADKIQNYKDFSRYHIITHPRAAELSVYFFRWFEVLGIDDTALSILSSLQTATEGLEPVF